MLSLGICTSTEGFDHERDLVDLSPKVARFVLMSQRAWLPNWHKSAGRAVHGVAAAETFSSFGLNPHGDFRQCAEKARELWSDDLAYLEIGNEPDDSGGSSYAQAPAEFSTMLAAFHDVLHQGQHQHPTLISGGLNSGQLGFAKQVAFPKCPTLLFGLHDYDSRLRGWPSPQFGYHDLDFYIDVFESIWRLMAGVAITEWGHTSQDEAFGAEYVRRWVAIVREHPEVRLAEFFSLYDRQHPPHGLIRNDGGRKAAFGVYRDEIQKEASVLPLKVGQGIVDRMKSNSDYPIEDSRFQDNSNGSKVEECRGRKGRYIATNASGQWEIVFIPWGAGN